jgi:hypothetical protein
VLTLGALTIVALRPLPDESSAVSPESSSNLYEATSPAPGCPPASAAISVGDSAWL